MRPLKKFLLGCLLVLPLMGCSSSNAPYIGENGNWWVNGTDLGVSARGTQGPDGKPGSDGKDGNDGKTITIVSVTYDRTEGNKDYFKMVFSDGVEKSFYTTHGANGSNGANGINGQTPTIKDGNWWIGGIDTGVKAAGIDGQTVYIQSIEKTASENLVDTYTVTYSDKNSFKFTVTNGKDGKDGLTPYVGTNGNWWIGDEDTEIRAEAKDGKDGLTPYVGTNGNWWIGDEDTGALADPTKKESYLASDGLLYEAMTTNGVSGFVVTKYKGDSADVFVPNYVGSVPVTGIGATAFKGNEAIETVTLPETARFIEAGAFSGCTSLTEITGKNIDKIGKQAFLNCTSLKTATLAPLHKVGEQAFHKCSSLESLDLSKAQEFGKEAFYESGLGSEIVLSMATSIPELCFARCENLINVKLLACTKIEDKAFFNSQNLAEINLEGIETIGAGAFTGTSLEKISIESLEEMGSEAFSECLSLTSVEVPSSLKTIPEKAFNGCSKLETVSIADGVQIISDFAFLGAAIKDIVVPDSVVKMGKGVFAKCNALEAMTIPFVGESRGMQSFDAVMPSYGYSIEGSFYVLGFLFYTGDPGDGIGTTQHVPAKNYYGNIDWYGGFIELPTPQSLRSVVVTDEDYVKECAFNGFTLIESITYTTKINRVGANAFRGCTNLNEFLYAGTTEEWASVSLATWWDRDSGLNEITCTDGAANV